MEEKPIECSHCKKKADVIYSEMVGNAVTTWQMCRDCPVLQSKLQGKTENVKDTTKEEDLCCSNCHTSLESVLLGEPLGCKECYQVFQEVLIDQLTETDQVSPRLKPSPASQTPTLHIGKSPHIDEKALHSTRMRDLNEALAEALKGENYEEAAWLRDQINALMEKSDERA